jgi:hypothetical protein
MTIRMVAVAVWSILISFASAYAIDQWRTGQWSKAASSGSTTAKLASHKLRPVTIPIISDGVVQGYVIVHAGFVADEKLTKALSVKPETYLHDEVFRTFYAADRLDLNKLSRQNLTALIGEIRDSTNRRLGASVVADVLVHDINYILKDEARGRPRLSVRDDAAEEKLR